MRISLSTFNWADNILAAFIFFTRLPFWRLRQPNPHAYETVVEHWPLTGWLTGGLTAVALWGGSMLLPYTTAIAVALLLRVLLTGALHEDGLADFCDGFGGGGNDRERILAIMKDSHIGTYGVLGLVFYYLLLASCLLSMTPEKAAITIMAADPFCKMIAAQVIQMMPYARTADTAKNKVVYRKFSWKAGISLMIQGGLPIAIIWWVFGLPIDIIFYPCIVLYLLYLLLHHRLNGYTGDCCGAIFLLTELSFYMATIILW